MPRKPKPVAEEVRVRLQKAAEEARDRVDAAKAALEQRDRIVVEAVDVHDMSQTAIAKAIGVRSGRISAILAGSQPHVGADQ
jgi:DNA-directed RNA polymerase specialized sigma24 family protein